MQGPVGCETRTTDGLAGTFTVLHGFSVDAAAAAVVEIRDGSASGKILATGRVSASALPDRAFFERGIATAGGIWVEIVSGTPTVSVYGV